MKPWRSLLPLKEKFAAHLNDSLVHKERGVNEKLPNLSRLLEIVFANVRLKKGTEIPTLYALISEANIQSSCTPTFLNP